MIQLSSPLRTKNVRTLVDRVRDRIAALGCDRVWARSAGSHILLGLHGQEAGARLSPLGGGCFGLAFATTREAGAAHPRRAQADEFEPLLLVDTLSDVVEHALVALNALDVRDPMLT